ncbi:MAG TPA: hypothetical protein PLV52_04965, partial [Candidatus Omnitrophota bacterium]|nr:hypothetical protein [Candidatus Omnitrophota bacterium]
MRRLICLGILIAFLFNDIDMAVAGDLLRKDSSSALRPTNRFDPIANTEEEKALLERGFRETAEFLYVNKAMCRAIAMNFTDADELIAWIHDDLRGGRFDDFDYTKIYRENDSFYLPIKSKDNGSDILMRYFRLKGDEESPHIIKLAWHGVASIGLEFIDAKSGQPVSLHLPESTPVHKGEAILPEEPQDKYIDLKNGKGRFMYMELKAMPRSSVAQLLMDGGLNADEVSAALISMGFVDGRAVESGLLSGRVAAYSCLISDVVNPDHKGLVGLYAAAGA